MVCRFHGHFPALFCFPELELATLRGFKHYQLKTGEIPFSFGQPTGIDRPHYYCQHPLNSSQYVQLVYRLFCRNQDETLLREFYPSVKDAVNFAKSLDTDSDGLVNDHSHAPAGETWPANQFYDIWPWAGTSVYVASIWLATLKMAEKMAILMDDVSFAKDCQVWFNRGSEAFDAKLWNGKYYRLYNDTQNGKSSEVCLANQLMGQWCSQIVGISDLLPKDRIRSALDSIGALNFRATECGIVNGCLSNGKRDLSGGTHSSEIFVGESLCVAMTMLYSNRKRQGLEIAKRIYESIALRHKTPWNQYCLIGAEKGQPVWGSDYYSDMAIWALPMAILGQDIAEFSKPGGFLDGITKADNGLK
jgi:non-lysosomal glucosylceramidase